VRVRVKERVYEKKSESVCERECVRKRKYKMFRIVYETNQRKSRMLQEKETPHNNLSHP
jgi:hypothetical protein